MMKEYLESVERGKKEQIKLRHHFFAQHPELVGRGRNLWEETEESETKTVYQDMQWTPRQWDYVRQLEARLIHNENKLKELQTLKIKRKGKY